MQHRLYKPTVKKKTTPQIHIDGSELSFSFFFFFFTPLREAQPLTTTRFDSTASSDWQDH